MLQLVVIVWVFEQPPEKWLLMKVWVLEHMREKWTKPDMTLVLG